MQFQPVASVEHIGDTWILRTVIVWKWDYGGAEIQKNHKVLTGTYDECCGKIDLFRVQSRVVHIPQKTPHRLWKSGISTNLGRLTVWSKGSFY